MGNARSKIQSLEVLANILVGAYSKISKLNRRGGLSDAELAMNNPCQNLPVQYLRLLV